MQENNKSNILLGYSGHAYVVAEAFLMSGGEIKGYTDISEAKLNPFDLKYLGNEGDNLFTHWNEGNAFILAIGDNSIRMKIADLVKIKGMKCQTVIHPASSISSFTTIGEGTFIARNVSVNPFCKIGKAVILNTASSIDHECEISDGVHLAPGAVLAGNVRIGKGSFIGANSVIKQGVTIGDNVVVGAGSVVLNDITKNLTVVGNPSKELKQ